MVIFAVATLSYSTSIGERKVSTQADHSILNSYYITVTAPLSLYGTCSLTRISGVEELLLG